MREAHPADGWSLAGNDQLGISVPQPKEYGERCKVAADCRSCLKMTIPMVVDELDDRAGVAYSGMPDRLYVVDTQGRVAYKGGRGPFGFKPSEMEQALVMLFLEEARGPGASPPAKGVGKDR